MRYLKSPGRQYELCGMRGITLSSVNIWVYYGLSVMLKTPREKSVPEFRDAWPTVEEMDKSYELLRLNPENGALQPILFGVIDGGRIPCADYNYQDLKNAYYEGCTGNVEVTNIFAFNFF